MKEVALAGASCAPAVHREAGTATGRSHARIRYVTGVLGALCGDGREGRHLSAPALAGAAVRAAEAMPQMTVGPSAARWTEAAPLSRLAVRRACASWWRAEAHIACAGCPAPLLAAWRSRARSALGSRQAARLFPARPRGHATWSRAAANQEKAREARLTRRFPAPWTEGLPLARMRSAARRPQQQAGSIDPGRLRDRTAGSAPVAAIPTNQVAELLSRSSAWPCCRRPASPR